MNLSVDIGNTLVKAAVFEKGQVVENFKSEANGAELVLSVLENYPDIESGIIVSTTGDDHGVIKTLEGKGVKCVRFDADTPVPLKNLYKTPRTLGSDRLAAAVGAGTIYPGANVLVVDFGTAITIDVVTKEGEFVGGNISPGAGTRLRSLHEFTEKLPLVALDDNVSFISDNSEAAILSGVVNGIVYEIEGYISRLEREYDDLRIIFTGGDGNFFAKRLKNPIFATYDLVVYGLNRILEYNAD